MGRMLESLKMGPKPLAEQCVVDWTLREPEEVPYIEIGSGKKVEGSAQVMAVKHPPQQSMQPPHLSAPHLSAPHLPGPHLPATHPAAPQLPVPHLPAPA